MSLFHKNEESKESKKSEKVSVKPKAEKPQSRPAKSGKPYSAEKREQDYGSHPKFQKFKGAN